MNVNPVYAVCTAEESVNFTDFTNFQETLFEKFPFSIVGFSIDILEDLASISPESPSGITIHIVGMDITPLGWLESSTFDVLASGIRIILLALLIFSVAKHVIERIL